MPDNQLNNRSGANELFEQSEICLFELSESGTVLYCRTSSEGLLNLQSDGVVGRNFFEEVPPFENTDELRSLFSNFVKSDRPTKEFNFDCRIRNKTVPVNIQFVRLNQRSGCESKEATIVDIRKISVL